MPTLQTQFEAVGIKAFVYYEAGLYLCHAAARGPRKPYGSSESRSSSKTTVSRYIQFGAEKRDIRDNLHRLKLTVPGPFTLIVHDKCAARLLVGLCFVKMPATLI
jgi:hypothetical protein